MGDKIQVHSEIYWYSLALHNIFAIKFCQIYHCNMYIKSTFLYSFPLPLA